MQKRVGSTSFGLPVRKGTESSVTDPNLKDGSEGSVELAVHPAVPRHRVLAFDRSGARRRNRRPVRRQGDAGTGRFAGSRRRQRRSDDGDGDVTTTTDTATAGRALARPAAGRIARKWLKIGLYIGPAVVLYAIFIIVPVAQAVHYSFYDWDGLQPLTDYIGLGNYREAFGDPAFRQAMGHNTILVALSLGLQLPLALGLALLLNRPFRGRRVLRLVFFTPYVISEAVTAIVFLQILQPDGLVDAAFRAVGLGSARPALARRPRARLLHPVRRHHVEVHRLRNHPLPRGPARHPARVERGSRDGRRNELDDAALHHDPDARADDSHLGVPRGHRLDPAVRHRLDHDARWTLRARRRRWRPT